jgi:hypothetical protein
MTGVDLLDYTTSPLNPALKLLTFIIFLAVTGIYLDTRRKFGGEILNLINLLLLFSITMAGASLCRYFGHGTGLGFTPEYSLKWFQSLAYLSGAVCFLLAARKLLNLFRRPHE